MRQPFDPDMLTPFERALLRLDDPTAGKPTSEDLFALLDEPRPESRDWNRLSRIMSDPQAVEALRATVEARALAKELGILSKPQVPVARLSKKEPLVATPPVLHVMTSEERIIAPRRAKPLLWVTGGALAVAATILFVVFIKRTPGMEDNAANRTPTSIERLDGTTRDLEQFVAQGSWKLRDFESVRETTTVPGERWLSEPSLANEAIYRNQEFKWNNTVAQVELWDVTDSSAVETELSSGAAKPNSPLKPNHLYEVRMKDRSGTRIARFRALTEVEEQLVEQAKRRKGSLDICVKVLLIAGRYEDAKSFLDTHADELGEQTKGLVRAAYIKRGEMTGQHR